MNDFTDNSELYNCHFYSKAFVRDLLFSGQVLSGGSSIYKDIGKTHTLKVTPELLITKHAIQPNALLRFSQEPKNKDKEIRLMMIRNDAFQLQEEVISNKEELLCVQAITSAITDTVSAAQIDACIRRFNKQSGFDADTMICGAAAWSKIAMAHAIHETDDPHGDEDSMKSKARLTRIDNFDVKEIYTYSNLYSDDGGHLHDMMPPDSIIITTKSAPGLRMYGAINYRNKMMKTSRLRTIGIETNPRYEVAQTISAPYMNLAFPDAVMCFKIV